MKTHPAQKSLPVTLASRHTFSDFITGDNQELLSTLTTMNTATTPQQLMLWGEEAVGKTHLLHACCRHFQQHNQPSLFLNETSISSLSLTLIQELHAVALICIDNLDKVVSSPQYEELLFALYNKYYLHAHIIIASPLHPRDLRCKMADLYSRLQCFIAIKVKPPGGDDLMTVVSQVAEQRGIEITDTTLRYLMNHGHRDLTILLNLIDYCEGQAFNSRRLTIPMVRNFFQRVDSLGELN